MMVTMGVKGVWGGGCGENVGDVCTRVGGMLAGKGAGDGTRCRAESKGTQSCHGLLVSLWRTTKPLPATEMHTVVLFYGCRRVVTAQKLG